MTTRARACSPPEPTRFCRSRSRSVSWKPRWRGSSYPERGTGGRGRDIIIEAARYPEELSHPVPATDGTRALVRAIRPEDAERLMAFHDRLGEHTIYQRFFTVMK